MGQYPRKLKRGLRWHYKFDYNGVTYFSTFIYLSKGEARKAENARYDEVSSKLVKASYKADLSLKEAIKSRLLYIKGKKSKRYYIENKSYYNILLDRFDDIPIENIRKSDINTLLLETSADLKSNGFDNYKVNSMLRITKALFNHAIDENDLNIKNPCVGIKPFSVKRKLKYIPPDEDIEAVLNICDDEEKRLINFVRESACRINEALRFTETDLFPDYIILYTRKSKNSDLVPRKVPRPHCLKGISLKTDELLFVRWTTYPRFLEDRVKELGQRTWSWHNLRHKKASEESKKGTPLFDIMCLLGHSNLKTTQGYLQQLG